MVRGALFLALALSACGPRIGVPLAVPGPRTVEVGRELQLTIRAADTAASLRFESDLADLTTRPLRPTLTPFAGGEASFRWTPLGEDVGDHVITFIAELNGATTRGNVPVTVVAGEHVIVFREPAGDGSTLPSGVSCVDVGFLVDDPAAVEVAFVEGPEWPSSATLESTGALEANVHFCASAADRLLGVVPLVVQASDDSGASGEKRYVVVLN